MKMKNLSNKIKKLFEHFFMIDDTPHKVAAGAALGIFSGTVPGEGLITALILASIFRFNRLSTTLGVFATNMWMTIITLPPAAYIGSALFGTSYRSLVDDFNSTYDMGWKYFLSEAVLLDIVLPLMVGFVITAGMISLAFYFLLYFLLKNKKINFK